MNHGNTKNMLFDFLRTRDYNKDSGKLAFDYGYDLGDYSGPAEFAAIAADCAQLLRTRLAGVFNEDGDIKSTTAIDTYGQFHKETQ